MCVLRCSTKTTKQNKTLTHLHTYNNYSLGYGEGCTYYSQILFMASALNFMVCLIMPNKNEPHCVKGANIAETL